MAIYKTSSPIVSNGLVLCLDAANVKSYPTTGTTWFDLSGNNNSGSLINGVVYNSGVMTFDGSNDYITFGDVLNFDNINPLTITTWMRTTSNTSMVLISKGKNTNPFEGYSIYINTDSNGSTSAGKIAFWITNNNTTNNTFGLHTSNVAFTNNNTWKYLCVTYNGSSNANGVKIYVNGSSVNTTIGTNNLTGTSITTYPFQIGARNNAGGVFNGSIGITHIYNRELAEYEICRNFNATRGRYNS